MGALATATASELEVLFVILAIVAFGVAVWLAAHDRWPAGLAVALIAVLILIFGLD